MAVIGKAHQMLHDKGIPRIQTDIRVGTRYAFPPPPSPSPGLHGHAEHMALTGSSASVVKVQRFAEKVEKVNQLLAADT
jgi:hypothetical protein